MIVELKIATVKEEAIQMNKRLNEMGIDSDIEDEDVEYIRAWVNTNHISFVEETKGGYNINTVDGSYFFSETNPLI